MSTDHDAGNSGTWDESILKYIDQSGGGGISAITGWLNKYFRRDRMAHFALAYFLRQNPSAADRWLTFFRLTLLHDHYRTHFHFPFAPKPLQQWISSSKHESPLQKSKACVRATSTSSKYANQSMRLLLKLTNHRLLLPMISERPAVYIFPWKHGPAMNISNLRSWV